MLLVEVLGMVEMMVILEGGTGSLLTRTIGDMLTRRTS